MGTTKTQNSWALLRVLVIQAVWGDYSAGCTCVVVMANCLGSCYGPNRCG